MKPSDNCPSLSYFTSAITSGPIPSIPKGTISLFQPKILAPWSLDTISLYPAICYCGRRLLPCFSYRKQLCYEYRDANKTCKLKFFLCILIYYPFSNVISIINYNERVRKCTLQEFKEVWVSVGMWALVMLLH